MTVPLKDIFLTDINRHIDGVIKADDCASVYLLVFIRNLLVHPGEKILPMQPLAFGVDYP